MKFVDDFSHLLVTGELASGAVSRLEAVQGDAEKSSESYVLKTLKTEYQKKDQVVERFMHEVQVNRFVRHTRLIQPLAVCLNPENPGVLFPLVKGQKLMPWKFCKQKNAMFSAAVIVQKLLDVVSYLHDDQGGNSLGYVIHGDIGFNNIHVGESGELFLLDFGHAHSEMLDPKYKVTPVSISKGASACMAPELLQQGVLDRRIDIYSVGAVLFSLISGRPTFDIPNNQRVVFKQSESGSDSSDNAGELILDAERMLSEVLEKSLAIDPNDRYQSAKEMNQAISKMIELTRSSL